MGEYLRMKLFVVLEAAKDNNDQFAVDACRRLLEANRKGWRLNRNAHDVELVNELFEACRE